MASVPGLINFQQFTASGDLAALYRLYTYTQGTTTHKDAFTDVAGTIAHTYTSDGAGGQYIALDARGELPAPLYLSAGAYDLALKTAAGATIWTRRADGLLADFAASLGSALVGFLQAGTGATARTAQAKMRESVSVKDFGAVGDGVTDDTAAIELASSSSAAGTTIIVPVGMNCLVASAVDLNVAGQRLIAYGAKFTKRASFTGTSVIRIGAADVTVEGLEIDGTDKVVDGIITAADVCAGFTARANKIYNCAYGISANNNNRVLLENNNLSVLANYGIRVHNIADTAVYDDIRVIGNRIDLTDQTTSSTQVGMLIRGTATYLTTNVMVANNRTYLVSDPLASGHLGCEVRFADGGSFQGNYCIGGAMLVSIAASKNFVVDGNVAIGQTFYAIELASISAVTNTNNVVSNNTIRGNGILNYAIGLQGSVAGCLNAVITGNNISGIVLYGVFANDVWDDITISGNTISFTDAGTNQYGIYLLGTTTRTISEVAISGNKLNGGGVAEKAIFLLNVSNATVSGNNCIGWGEHGVYISITATVTVDNISITGNLLSPSGSSAIGKVVSGTMGDHVTARGNPSFRLSNALGSDVLNYSVDLYEAWGVNTPEGAVTAGVGSIYHRTNGGASTSIYIKETGTGNTGWVGK